MRIRRGGKGVCWGVRDEGTEKICDEARPLTFMGRQLNVYFVQVVFRLSVVGS